VNLYEPTASTARLAKFRPDGGPAVRIIAITLLFAALGCAHANPKKVCAKQCPPPGRCVISMAPDGDYVMACLPPLEPR
jgi:hypothetical protein